MGFRTVQLDYAHRQRSRAKQAINYESISYHDTISGRGSMEGGFGGGFAFAVQPHQGSGGVVVATRLRTLTGSVRSRGKQAICESISYHDTISGRVWEGGGRGGMEVDV